MPENPYGGILFTQDALVAVRCSQTTTYDMVTATYDLAGAVVECKASLCISDVFPTCLNTAGDGCGAYSGTQIPISR
jgi:hypothetical protein